MEEGIVGHGVEVGVVVVEDWVVFWGGDVAFHYDQSTVIKEDSAKGCPDSSAGTDTVRIFPFCHVYEMHVAEINAPEGIRPIDSVEKGGCIFIADGEFVSSVVNGVSVEEKGNVFLQSSEIEV